MINRRHFLALTAGVSVTACFDQGLWNPCLSPKFEISPLQQQAWQGIEAKKVWDSHVHLVGIGDSDSGIWVHPSMLRFWHVTWYGRMKFYLNASCVAAESQASSIDQAYVQRLVHLQQQFHPDSRLMLLAFDYFYSESGEKQAEKSTFYTPNHYAYKISQQYPQSFVWVASIHPYRKDALEQLTWAVEHGAKAIKWLPPAMGINPNSPLCDDFYQALVKFNLPLITHVGKEEAVRAEQSQSLANPLLVRRALEHGVRVVMAHCASHGQSFDLDQPSKTRKLRPNFELFTRMMHNPDYEPYLFADISAITQVNRDWQVMASLIQQQQWHSRLLNGSDYPLPGVMPLFSMKMWLQQGMLTQAQADELTLAHQHHPLLFDFLLKRYLRYQNQSLSAKIFMSKDFFDQS